MVFAVAWFVYIVRCRDGTLYTGATKDLDKRVLAHNAGRGASYTRARRPVVLVFSRRTRDKSSALRQEYRLKQLTRAQKLALVTPGQRSPGTGSTAR
jgi:putative endonuclease